MMRVGLFGGSFDPVHNGHLRLAAAALRQLRLDNVYFVLSPKSPHKVHRSITPAEDRKRLLALAISGKRGFRIGRWELDRKGPSYTVDTLRRYLREYPRQTIYWIMGSDSFRGFSRWKRPEAILRVATLVVGRRPGTAKIRIPKRWDGRVILLQGRFPDIASNRIRLALKKRRLTAGRIPPNVFRAIQKRGLYR